MANAKIAPSIPFSSPIAETITEAKELVASDSGKQFFVAQGTGAYVINLPKLSTSLAGWNAEFILTTIGDAVEINGYGVPQGGHATTGDGDLFYVVEIGHTEAVSTGQDGVQFGASASSIGARFQITTDGTSWYAMGFGGVAADIDDVDTDA